jgi:hypothetical protein
VTNVGPSEEIGGFEMSGTGIVQEAPGALDKIPPYDPRTGEHYWIIPVVYHVGDPAAWFDPAAGKQHLDMENLVLVAGVGCYHCEKPYEARMLHRRCPGEPR